MWRTTRFNSWAHIFTLYINDIINCSDKLRFILFVDDTNAFLTENSVSNLLTSVNVKSNRLNEWFCTNKLSLNVSKVNICCLAINVNVK